MTDTAAPAQAAELRAGLVGELRDLEAIRSEPVARAVLTVPRHLFMPEVAPDQAYAAEFALTTKRDGNGVALSSVSAARIQAFMLEQARIEPGMRVLEIGSGGYNAALIAELVGPAGAVTTVDIDPDVTGRATRLLAEAGYERVRVITADGACGASEHAPFDRIIVTAEAADIAPEWVRQLAAAGRLVLPLRVRGLTRSIAFERQNAQLASLSYELCGFVPMRGPAASSQQIAVLHDQDDAQVALRVDDGPQADARALAAALREPASNQWSGVLAGPGTPFDDLDLWLATVLPGYAVLAASRPARDRGIVSSASPIGVSAMIDRGSFAYLTLRDISTDRSKFEFGAAGHGPDGHRLAELMAARARTWGKEHRDNRARFRAEPIATTPAPVPIPGLAIDRPNYRITITWPQTASTASKATTEPKEDQE